MKSSEISSFLQERIDACDFPSAVYLIAEKGEIVFQDALGYSVVTPERIKAKFETIYDVASLTKPLVTGLLAAQQIEDNDIQLETRIGNEHTAFDGSPISAVTVKDLATHTSDLPAWRPFYLLTNSPTPLAIGRAIGDQELATGEKQVVYSDLNFIALAILIEQNRPDFEFDLEVVKKLGLRRTCFNPLAHGLDGSDIAASEFGNEHEKRTCREMGYEAPDDKFRDYQIWGEVHDGNAWFMGGTAGHAGLFSTAEEVFRIALQFLPAYTTLLKPETCKLFRMNFTKGMNEARSFAFELAETPRSTAGSEMSPESFGHLGFTGTSLWIDPVYDRIFILLTNRTHNHSLPFTNINSVRRRFHDLANKVLNVQK